MDLQSLFNWKPIPPETEFDRMDTDGMRFKASLQSPDIVLAEDQASAGISVRFNEGKVTYYPDPAKPEPVDVELGANWQVTFKVNLKIARDAEGNQISRVDFDFQNPEISFQNAPPADEGFKDRLGKMLKGWMQSLQDVVTPDAPEEPSLLRLNIPETDSFWKSYVPMVASHTVAPIINSDNEDARLIATEDYFKKRGYGFEKKAKTGAPYGYGEGQVSFTRWEVERGVFHPTKGSPWWKAMNARILNDMEQAAIIYELELVKNAPNITTDPGVMAWLNYLTNPTQKSWYRAHNTSVMEGYVANADLVKQESFLEQIFVCNVLSHVLFAEAMVNDKTILPSEFANPAGTNLFHLFGNILPELKDVYVDSVQVAVTISLFYPNNYPLHEPLQGLVIAETYLFDRASDIATLVKQNIIDPARYGEVIPAVVETYREKMENLVRTMGGTKVWKMVIDDGVAEQEVVVDVARAVKALDDARALVTDKPVKSAQTLVKSILGSLNDKADDVADSIKDKVNQKESSFMAGALAFANERKKALESGAAS